MTNKTVFCARDVTTGKLVSNITNPSRKYWTTRKCCENAIANAKWHDKRQLEVVEYALVEVKDGKYNPKDLAIYGKGE